MQLMNTVIIIMMKMNLKKRINLSEIKSSITQKVMSVNTKIIYLVRLTYLINCGTITQGI
mgnify:FL=1